MRLSYTVSVQLCGPSNRINLPTLTMPAFCAAFSIPFSSIPQQLQFAHAQHIYCPQSTPPTPILPPNLSSPHPHPSPQVKAYSSIPLSNPSSFLNIKPTIRPSQALKLLLRKRLVHLLYIDQFLDCKHLACHLLRYWVVDCCHALS